MPTIAGSTFPPATQPMEYAPDLDQDAWVSPGGTFHAYEQRSQEVLVIRLTMHGLSQAQASTLDDKWRNVARQARNAITLRLDGDATDRTVHFAPGRRGLVMQKHRNDLFSATCTFWQVGGTPTLVP